MTRKFLLRGAAYGLAATALALTAIAAGAQTLPSPRQFVDNLDLRCYQITDQSPINQKLRLDHLNPVLIGLKLPFENVVLQQPEDLCVPVYKNSSPPPANVLPFIEWLDWKCYGISGPDINTPLTLTQLNPVISGLIGPTVQVTAHLPQQLCVPVLKAFTQPPAQPPPAVQALIEWLDVKCYSVTAPASKAALSLTHLNPLFSSLPAEDVTIGNALQLCVPVMKNQTQPPSTVLPIVEFADTLCYQLNGAPLGTSLWLTHLNPVLLGMGLQPEFVPVNDSDTLCVPVAKNGMLPPGPP